MTGAGTGGERTRAGESACGRVIEFSDNQVSGSSVSPDDQNLAVIQKSRGMAAAGPQEAPLLAERWMT